MNTDHVSLGRKAIKFSVDLLYTAVALSSWFMYGWALALLITVLGFVLATIVNIYTKRLVSDESCASLGSALGGAYLRVTGLFNRKEIA